MSFIEGVVFIKEVVGISFMGLCIFGVMILITAAMMFGGAVLYIDGCHDFSDSKKILGIIISLFGLILLLSIGFFASSDFFINFFDDLNLTDHTGMYEVTVTADTDMNEFKDCYDIIDFENGVYTIKIKEN